MPILRRLLSLQCLIINLFVMPKIKVYSFKQRLRFFNDALDYIGASECLDLRFFCNDGTCDLLKVTFAIPDGELESTILDNFKGYYRWRASAVDNCIFIHLYF